MQYLASLFIILLVLLLTVLLVDRLRLSQTSTLTQNWNFSSATGPNLYQWLARSLVFVKVDPALPEKYSLMVIERGTSRFPCPAYSELLVDASIPDLRPFVGKAILVTSFTRGSEQTGAIRIERLEVDAAVNERLSDYRKLCPTPFQHLDRP